MTPLTSPMLLDKDAASQSSTVVIYKRPHCVPKEDPTMIVLGGGGSKIVAMLGALTSIESKIPTFLSQVHTYVGTSAGAILSILLCCRYSLPELRIHLKNLNMLRLLSLDLSSLLVGTGMGIDSGAKYLEWITERMTEKGIHPMITLKQLRELTGMSLITVTTDLLTRSTYLFSADSDPDTPALMAVRASFGIPLWFTRIRYRDMLLLDGGLTLNCAFYKVIEDFADEHQDIVFGLDLNFAAPQITKSEIMEQDSLVDYVSLLAELFIGSQNDASAHELTNNDESRHKIHYITLSKHFPLLMVTDEDKEKLFIEGFNSIV